MRIAILLLSLASGALSAAAAPPKVFVQEDACPSECCKYGEWSVLKDSLLFDRPHGKAVGRLRAGQKALALGGRLFVEPTKAKVLVSTAGENGVIFAKGKALYLLSPEGEGHYSVWYEGKVYSHYFDVGFNSFVACDPPSAACWLRLQSAALGKRSWWARFKTAKGEAWAAVEFDRFDGIDTCS